MNTIYFPWLRRGLGATALLLAMAGAAQAQTVWTGTVSTDWFTSGNWTAGVPTTSLDAVIPGGVANAPSLGAGAASVRSLTLNSGATLNQSGGTLDVRGSLTNDGSYNATGGSVVLGTTFQSSGPNILGASSMRFWDLTVNSNGVLLSTSAGASVQRLLTLNGALATQSNPFTLESSSAATALVVNNGGTVQGAATVQRYIDPSQNSGMGYRHYSSPVQATDVADLATGTFTPVVNGAYNTAAAPTQVLPFPTVFGYDESRVTNASALTQSFERGFFSPAALGDQLAPGRGYAVNIDAASKVDLTGSLNNGTIAVGALTRGTEANSGWHLLGNPYPAPLDWNVARTNLPAGVIDAVYVFKSSTQYAGTYQFYQNGFGTLPGGLIGAMQGFFVQVSQSVSSFNFLNAWRSTAYQNPAFQRGLANARPSIQLDLVTPQGEQDAAFVYFEHGATDGIDDHYDAAKLPNTTGLNLSSTAAGTDLAVNGYPVLGTSQQVVPLVVGVPAPGSYTLTAAQLLNLNAMSVYLRDLLTGAVVDLTQQPSYQFTVSSASAPITGRFELMFSPQQALATVPAALAEQVAVYPNPATSAVAIALPASLNRQPVTATLVDAMGREARTLALPAQGTAAHQLDLHGLAPGVYALRLSTSAGVVVKKLAIK